MKLYLLPAFVCATIVAVSPMLRAQDAPAASGSSAPQPPPPGGPGEGGHHRGGNPMDKMAKDLGLTDDQKAKIKPIMEDRHEKMKALHEDTTLTPEQKKEKGKAIMDAGDDQIKALLTPDQLPKFEQFLADMKAHHRGPGGPPPGAPGSAPAPAPAN